MYFLLKGFPSFKQIIDRKFYKKKYDSEYPNRNYLIKEPSYRYLNKIKKYLTVIKSVFFPSSNKLPINLPLSNFNSLLKGDEFFVMLFHLTLIQTPFKFSEASVIIIRYDC